MQNSFYIALVLSLISGMTIIIGGYLFSLNKMWEKKYIDFFIALGAGYILSVAFIEMIPESLSLSKSPYIMLFVVIGYSIVHFFEHVSTSHFHYGEETHGVSKAVGTSALIGLLVHNFFSGVAIASGIIAGTAVGILIFAGVILHKLPEGFTISSIIYVSSKEKTYTILPTVLLALSSILGTILIYVSEFRDLPFQSIALAISAGTFIHVSATDLIPAINTSENRTTPFVIFLGIFLFFITSFVLKKFGLH
jgi:zinc transporter ZupT